MDRDTTIIMAATIIFLTLVGSLYLSPGGTNDRGDGLGERAAAAGVAAGEVPTSGQGETDPDRRPSAKFNPDDIRFKYQQAEAKKGKKRKFMQAAPEDTGTVSENEEPAAEEPTIDESAEEPEIND
jgi:hypothetical protein